MNRHRRFEMWSPRRVGPLAIACAALAALLVPARGAELNRLLLVDCRIATLVEGEETVFPGFIVVGADGRISQIGHGRAPPDIEADHVFDAAGKIALPGFISAHGHLTGSTTRGLATDKWVTDWVPVISWLRSGGNVAEGDYYYYTLHGAIDLLRGGVTTAYNYTARAPGTEDALYFEQLDAQFAAGGHFVFGYQAPVRDERKTVEALKADVRAFLDRARKHPRADLMLRPSFGSVSMWWTEDVSRREFELLKAFPEFENDMQMHYLEPPPAVARTLEERARFGWLEKYGILGPNLTFAHFIHPTDEILERSVAAGAAMVWNPLSNGRLGSGFADVPRYRQLGMVVGMGIDGQSSADVGDPFENMRVGMYGLRFRDQDPRGLQPLDMLRLHTLHAARAIRVADRVGTLEAGKLGDILLIDPHWPDTGPIIDYYATLVFACDRMNISSVFVAGKHVMQQGKHTAIDMTDLSREVHRRIATKKGNPAR